MNTSYDLVIWIKENEWHQRIFTANKNNKKMKLIAGTQIPDVVPRFWKVD